MTDLAGLKAFRQYIADVLDAAAKAKAAGKSKEDFLKDVDLPAYKDWTATRTASRPTRLGLRRGQVVAVFAEFVR